ncbi:AUGMIN subunit 5-like [Neltuma alba]|uniref:AUGMIN subunit 5-like n=1 Tax=Neltuma alba TaxID=207710 RepID=UPI0010A49455|nr:AUGMIN subunit 5-like [Prosopis alba]
MQSSLSSVAQPEAILEWLQMEMGYRPLPQYGASNLPWEHDSGWNFLITRVKSEKTVENIRRNIAVHGDADHGGSVSSLVSAGKEEGRSKGRKKEKILAESSSAAETREAALQERDLAEKEVERLRNIVRRQRKDLRARMLEVSREEAERKRMLDERANYRHKQVMLEAYDRQCDDEAAKYLLNIINVFVTL